ncbi:MAG: TadE/TadG family type IV pilus assembly protein [Rothia sp. (in: high G+C Gram-positive bacteria)]|nr:TadE/TadG family type IV pilus assembly protein [Rothia sp. (in: high G+C Gram-positive bacteria)]
MMRLYKSFTGRAAEPEAGNASAEFVMVTSLTLLLFALVLQVAFAIYTRNILIDAAASGARYATLLDRSSADGLERTQQIIDRSLPDTYVTHISAQQGSYRGVESLEITVEGTLPVVGPFGFDRAITVSGHALRQAEG